MGEDVERVRETCLMCGEERHRYGLPKDRDGHDYDAVACVNMLRPALEETRRSLREAREERDALLELTRGHGGKDSALNMWRRKAEQAQEALEEVRSMVQTWEWIPERGDVIETVDAALTATPSIPPPTEEQDGKDDWPDGYQDLLGCR